MSRESNWHYQDYDPSGVYKEQRISEEKAAKPLTEEIVPTPEETTIDWDQIPVTSGNPNYTEPDEGFNIAKMEEEAEKFYKMEIKKGDIILHDSVDGWKVGISTGPRDGYRLRVKYSGKNSSFLIPVANIKEVIPATEESRLFILREEFEDKSTNINSFLGRV